MQKLSIRQAYKEVLTNAIKIPIKIILSRSHKKNKTRVKILKKVMVTALLYKKNPLSSNQTEIMTVIILFISHCHLFQLLL